MVITSTGAAAAVAKAYPALAGKLTGNAIRVPTPNVSMAILNLSLKQESSVETVNAALEAASVAADTQKQIGFRWSTEPVSSDPGQPSRRGHRRGRDHRRGAARRGLRLVRQ